MHVILISSLVLSIFSFSIHAQVINFDSPRGGISLVTEKGRLTTSRLLVQKAIHSDSGMYTCSPSNANPASVRVHILNGKMACVFHLVFLYSQLNTISYCCRLLLFFCSIITFLVCVLQRCYMLHVTAMLATIKISWEIGQRLFVFFSWRCNIARWL